MASMTEWLRNLLLMGLTFAAGCVDAISYLALGRVFTANMTGNLVLLGLAVAQSLGPEAQRSVVALVAFAAGVAIAANVGRARATEEVWPARITLALAVEVVLLIGFAAAWWSFGRRPVGEGVLGLVALAGLAMGMQSATARQLAVRGVSTTFVTGTLTTLVSDVVTLAGPPGGWSLNAGVLAALLLGAVIGGITEVHAPLVAAILPAAIVALVVVAAVLGFRESHGRS
jgi:uncharacterized membrane protein YoaK (UPF0700 family)